jgi:tetratricopeptide (TPR) repeat protein
MLRTILRWGAVAAALILLAGCAATNHYAMGRTHLEREEYDAAIEAFAAARESDPGNPLVAREMGIAYYSKIDFDKAIPLLLEALVKDSTDGRTLFYLGTAYEIVKDYGHAMDLYRRYADVEKAGTLRSNLEARFVGLLRKQRSEEAKAVLAGEAALAAAPVSDSTIAVLAFRNTGKKSELDPIQKGLADMLITDLSKVRQLRVVERVRLVALVQEMNLGTSGLVDDASVPRVGRLLGASTLVRGTFLDLPKEGVRIDADFVRPHQDRTIVPSKVQGKMAKFFQLEKDLVFGLVDRMGIPLSQAEKDEIRIIPTENLLAFLAYSRGLDLEDRGLFAEAEAEFRKAVELDPAFKKAGEAASRAESLQLSEMKMADLQILYAEMNAPAGPEEPAGPAAAADATETKGAGRSEEAAAASPLLRPGTETSALVERMMQTADMLDRGFLPGVDSREPSQEREQPAFGNSASFELSIPLPPE